MIDTGRTVCLATRLLKANGAKEIYVIVSHGMVPKNVVISDNPNMFIRSLRRG